MGISNRRHFIKSGAAASLGFASACSSYRKDVAEKISELNNVIRYRNLGSTGYKVSEIGFGAMNTRNAELIHAAIDAGINYIDTAHGYMRGVNEEIIGTVMKTKRDKVFLTTKVWAGSSSDISDMLNTSLKRLQTDHVDLLLSHSASREQILSDDIMKKFDDFRRKGMVRFVGVSTHSNQAAVLDALVESKFWEAATVGYNYLSPKSVSASIKKARESGIAIIAMKTLLNPTSRPWKPLADIRKDKTSKITHQQALIKWVLENPNVDTTVPGMESFEHLADDLAIMGMELTFDDQRSLRRYSENIKEHYCSGVAGCTGCKDKCPKGVEVNEINRCLGYVYGYGNINLARENYKRLPSSSSLDICSDCSECQVKCTNGLNLTDNIKLARSIFA